MSREAMQQALEALEAMQSYAAAERKGLRICDEAITALKQALAEPEQKAKPITAAEMSAWVKDTWEKCQTEAWQEPVAWMESPTGGKHEHQ